MTLSDQQRELLKRFRAALGRRDLQAALVILRSHADANGADQSLAQAASGLARLIAAAERALATPTGATDLRTMKMGGHSQAELQVRMGNFQVAEKYYRRILLDNPKDAVARERLRDLLYVIRFAFADIAAKRAPVATKPDLPPEDTRKVQAADAEVTRRVVVDELRREGQGRSAAKEPDARPMSDAGLEERAEAAFAAGNVEVAIQIFRSLIATNPHEARYVERAAEMVRMQRASSCPPAPDWLDDDDDDDDGATIVNFPSRPGGVAKKS